MRGRHDCLSSAFLVHDHFSVLVLFSAVVVCALAFERIGDERRACGIGGLFHWAVGEGDKEWAVRELENGGIGKSDEIGKN